MMEFYADCKETKIITYTIRIPYRTIISQCGDCDYVVFIERPNHVAHVYDKNRNILYATLCNGQMRQWKTVIENIDSFPDIDVNQTLYVNINHGQRYSICYCIEDIYTEDMKVCMVNGPICGLVSERNLRRFILTDDSLDIMENNIEYDDFHDIEFIRARHLSLCVIEDGGNAELTVNARLSEETISHNWDP